MSRGLPRRVRNLLVKARQSALLAVETYNRPTASFRVHGYLVLMQIAWTSLLLAYFERKGVKPYYRRGKRFVKLQGEPKRWDLSQCVSQFWGGEVSPVRSNIEFMIALRDRTEHAEMPELDIAVFGECQALLNNFEEFFVSNFVTKEVLPHNLVVPLQFSGPPSPESLAALRRSIRPDGREILDWISAFRSTLANDVWESGRYSYRMMLLPNVKNNPPRDSLSVEFVKAEPGNEDDFARTTVLLKERRIPVVNEGDMKPSDVVTRVNLTLEAPRKLSLNLHSRCWRYFGVRPRVGAKEPWSTRGEYCRYDAVHKDYVYTDAWVKFLTEELNKPGRFEEVTSGRLPAPKTATPVASAQEPSMPSTPTASTN